mmetsp:Transcript_108577/g.187767  ORF Transcript_108577/g.187767 Transcript_108577/m.187767 type:complete len:91 (-) Transcript_108577:879-1151(-)
MHLLNRDMIPDYTGGNVPFADQTEMQWVHLTTAISWAVNISLYTQRWMSFWISSVTLASNLSFLPSTFGILGSNETNSSHYWSSSRLRIN